MISDPILREYDSARQTVVECDASGYVVGGALIQENDGLLSPVGYFSRTLLPADGNYPIHDKEMLAIVSCFRHWRSSLMGLHYAFEVWSDHRNLAFFRRKRYLSERQLRWGVELDKFNFKIIHRAGRLQVQSDALSRRDQDMPQEGDNRLEARNQQLLCDSSFNDQRVDNGNRGSINSLLVHTKSGIERREFSVAVGAGSLP